MKKLQSLGKSLSKDEQMKIMGGMLPPDEGGTCCVHTLDWSESVCGLSKADAIEYQRGWGPGSRWCCASC